MTSIADLNPDVALAALLDGKVTVQTSATQSRKVKCYAAGKQPEKGPGDEFISVQWNGAAQSLTRPLGLFRGNLMLIVSCKLLNSTRDGQTVNTGRVRKMLAQVAELTGGKTSQGFHFEFDPSAVITPTTTNLTTGYSTTILNVEWRVTDEFINN